MSKRPAPSTDLFGRVTDTQPATSASSAPATADRGTGAPSLYTAREAVRQDAVRFGSSDPSSAWSERRLMLNPRSRTEHLAIGSGQQNEMFAFTPGTRAVDPRSPEAVPYSDFHATWRKKSSVDAAERDYFAQSFARANKITAKKGDDGTITASVTIERNVFEGEGSDLYDAIDALAYTQATFGVGRAPHARLRAVIRLVAVLAALALAWFALRAAGLRP